MILHVSRLPFVYTSQLAMLHTALSNVLVALLICAGDCLPSILVAGSESSHALGTGLASQQTHFVRMPVLCPRQTQISL